MRSFLASTKLRLVGFALLLSCLLAGATAWARVPLTGWVLGRVLDSAGATEKHYNVVRASPWRVVVEDVGLVFPAQTFEARRVTIARRHWWMASLGAVAVEGARVPLRIEALTAPGAEPSPSPVSGLHVPAEQVSIEGRLIVQLGGQPDQALAVDLAAQQTEAARWQASATISGPGLALRTKAQYDPASGALEFQAGSIELDWKRWQKFSESVAGVSLEGWDVEGQIAGDLEGRWAGGALSARGHLRLRDGRILHSPQGFTAEGIEADLTVDDVGKVRTGPSHVRVAALQVGKLAASGVSAEFRLEGTERVQVAALSLQALGGKLAAEPFTYVFGRNEVDAVLTADAIDVAQVMALTEDLPAKATGRVSGRIPVYFGDGGLRFGTGWLGLAPGSNAEIQFNARGLLTGGASPSNPSYAVLQKIESGLLRLSVRELRLDIRPPGAVAGRSAQLHIAGQPVDPEVKAPVTLDLNVNGPLESLLNLGLKSRISVGTKP